VTILTVPSTPHPWFSGDGESSVSCTVRQQLTWRACAWHIVGLLVQGLMGVACEQQGSADCVESQPGMGWQAVLRPSAWCTAPVVRAGVLRSQTGYQPLTCSSF